MNLSAVCRMAVCFILLMAISDRSSAYQLLTTHTNIGGEWKETDVVQPDPTNTTYTYYVSDFYMDADAYLKSTPTKKYQVYKPISSIHLNLVHKAFEIVSKRAAGLNLSFNYGGTFRVRDLGGRPSHADGGFATHYEKKIYIDFTGYKAEVGETTAPSYGIAQRSSSSDIYATGGYIFLNPFQTDWTFAFNFSAHRIIIHEILHVLGAGHSIVNTASMSYNLDNSYAISNDDVLALQEAFQVGTTNVTVTSLMEGEGTDGHEVVFVNAVNGQSFMIQTNLEGVARSTVIPAGDYLVAARESSEATSGPCFFNKTTGFLTSFYVDESSSTNNPSAAATVTVGSTPVSITLHLIKQKKKFDCYHGTDGLLAYEENIFNNYEDTDGTAGYSRPGLTRAAQVTNDLWAHYTGIGSKASDTDPSSGVHASVQLQSLGSNPSVKVIENLPSYEGMIYRAGIKISPDARFGNYAAICSGGGEYALISNLIEVKENGGSFINLELLREMSDQFDYTKDGLIGSVDNKDQSPRLPGVAGPPLRVPDQKAIPILLNQMRNWEVALAVLLIFTSFLYFWSRRSGLQRWIVSSATLGIAFLACTKAPTTAGEFASLDEGGVTYETISYYLGAWAEGAWTSMSETDEPLGREGHSAIWNGSEMIVFGGSAEMDAYLQDGARYNPETDTWSAISTTNSASARAGHGAVWTGSKMLIWGGRNEEGALATGASYDSDADTWTAITTTNAPAARVEHSTVWTGTEMIVWGGWGGGAALSSGARYNPTTDTWTALSTVNAPSARYGHRAVWTGTEMIVWGGDSGSAKLNTGAIYNPANDTWTTISTTGAPEARSHFGMAYITGGNVHIFGGEGASLFLETHVSYDHTTDSWTELQNLGTNIGHPTVAVTGTTFYFTHGLRSRENLSPDLGVGYLNFYANTFFSYNPSENAIEVSAEDEPPRNLNPRRGSTMVWTGSQLLIWGGSGSDFIADNVSRLGRGAVFTP